MLPTEITVSELRIAMRQVYPAIEESDLDNMMLVLRARILLNRTLGR